MNSTTGDRYFLLENRWVLKLFAAKSPAHVQLFVIPMIILMAYVAFPNNFAISTVILGILAGILYWTFVEYLIHRFYFHWRPKNAFLRRVVDSFHHYHHNHPRDLEVINSGVVTAIGGLILHYSIWFGLSFGNTKFAAIGVLGLLLAYSYYEWVHYMVHKKHYKSGPMKYLQEFHLTHHRIPNKNYGQISPIWDFILGTQIENLEVKDDATMQSFITELREGQDV